MFSTRRSRIRKATRALSKDASAANYLALAKEYAALGQPAEVLVYHVHQFLGAGVVPGRHFGERLGDVAV